MFVIVMVLWLLNVAPVSVSVDKPRGLEPHSFTITVSYGEDAREVCLFLEDSGPHAMSRISCWVPKLSREDVRFKDLRQGYYEIWAEIKAAVDGKVKRSSSVIVEVQ